MINADRYQYHFPPSAVNHVWGLAITNGAIVHFLGYTNDVWTLTNILVQGASTLRFDMNSAGIRFTKDVNTAQVAGGSVRVEDRSTLAFAQGALGPPAVYVNVAATSTLYVASTSHVFTTLNVATGSTLFASTCNTEDVNAASGGTPANPHGSGVRIICQDANILGAIDVSLRGFISRTGPGCGVKDWDGGGYGGEGGHQLLPAANSGLCYGSLFRPSALGSGARYLTGQRGGGAVLLVASNKLVLNGVIRADGDSHIYGGTSGGSIWLVAKTLSGSGVIRATGGNGSPTKGHGSGGGGRIAVEYVAGGFDGTITVPNGYSLSSAASARTGTVFVCQSAKMGANSFGADGRTLDTALRIPNNDLALTRTIAQWGRTMEWSDTSTALSSGGTVTNEATYTIGGLQPSTRYEISLNAAPIGSGSTYSTPEGTVTLAATLADEPQTLRIVEATGGTILLLR